MTQSVFKTNLSAQPSCFQINVVSQNGATCLNMVLDQISPIIRLFRSQRVQIPGQAVSNDVCVLTTRIFPLGDYQSVDHTIFSGVHTVSFPDTSSKIAITPNFCSFTISLSSTLASFVQADFDLHLASWFGFGHLMYHHWPFNKCALFLSPAYPFDNGPTGLSTLLDPTFLSSSGALLSIHDDSPCLHVAVNAPIPITSTLASPFTWTTGLGNLHKEILPQATSIVAPRLLTFQSRNAYDHSHVYHPWSKHPEAALSLPSLTFSMSATKNVKQAALLSLANLRSAYGSAPCSSPKLNMMHNPIWSTWAQYKRDINQAKVLSFASQIESFGFPRSVMGIDDCWSASYGTLEFDSEKFPDPAEMVRELHALGFMVTLWVTPFANITSPTLTDPETRRYYVSMPDGEPGQFSWWQPGMAAALDVTDPEACSWFVGQLQALCDNYGIDGFKFDAGEPCFLPPGSALHHKLGSPNDYTRAWIHNVASKFSIAEVRSAVRGCQSAPPMFRIFDKYSTWSLQNGLASVLTAVLTSGILGFPFCIPDYVAGNAYGDEVPNTELMVRWTQASVAMCALQFSIPPWHFEDENCVKAVANALQWREQIFWPHIKECIEDASDKLWPIVRPMWWEEPELDGVPDVYDQFMVGNNLVVAPVVVPRQRERAVFLPGGVWRRIDLSQCKPDGDEFMGPLWMDRVSAGLNDMPVFIRIMPSEAEKDLSNINA